MRSRREYEVAMIPGDCIGPEISEAAVAVIEATGVPIRWREALHGAAPDIAGQGIANPVALILSGAMLLSHLGEVVLIFSIIAARRAQAAKLVGHVVAFVSFRPSAGEGRGAQPSPRNA